MEPSADEFRLLRWEFMAITVEAFLLIAAGSALIGRFVPHHTFLGFGAFTAAGFLWVLVVLAPVQSIAYRHYYGLSAQPKLISTLAWFAGGGLKCFSLKSSVVSNRTQPMLRAAFTN